jgi:tetratricopeptide (TPR) repeat protein
MDDSSSRAEAGSSRRSLSAEVVRAQTTRLLFGETQHVRIGRYRLERVLGRGGMGEVFVAHDPRLNREVALKVLRPGSTGNEELARLRLLREAQVMARLKHPNVVTVYDVGTHEQQVYVAMELVDGGTLRDWCDQEVRGWLEILGMFVEAGEGLAAAHRAGIVHRDFKPENVLVSEGRPQVVDFGIARAADDVLDRDPSASHSGALLATLTAGVMGTPAYMSPEQFAGRTPDARSDQFSFCAALWSALYGDLPFDGDAMETLRDNVMQGRRRTTPRRPRIPGRVRAAIERGLAADPADRFDGMSDLLIELRSPTRPRSLWALTGMVGFGAIALVALTRPGGQDLCRDGAARMEDTWHEERRAALAGAVGPAKDEIIPTIDAYVWQWTAALDRACEGPEVRRYSKLSCLEWRLVELDTLVDILGQPADGPASDLRQVLVPAEQCLDAEHLRSAPPPPEDAKARVAVQQVRLELASVRMRSDAASVQKARTLAQRANEIGYAPLQAEVQLAIGRQLTLTQQPTDAVAALEEAAVLGRRAHPEVEARAYVELLWISAFSQRRRERVDYLADHATHAIERLGDRPRLSAELNLKLAQALNLYGDPAANVRSLGNVLAAVQYYERIGEPSAMAHAYYGLILATLGRHEQARAESRRALEVAPTTGPQYRRAVGTAGLVHAIQGYDAQARPWLEQCAATPVVGDPAMPLEVGACSSWLGNVLRRMGDTDAALAAHARALELLPPLLGEDHILTGRAYGHRGETYLARGQFDLALADFAHAERIFRGLSEDSPELLVPGVGRVRTLLAQGDFEGAQRLLEDEVDAQLPRRTYGHFTEAQAYLAWAEIRAHNGESAKARARAQTALEIYERLGPGFADEAARAEALATAGMTDDDR